MVWKDYIRRTFYEYSQKIGFWIIVIVAISMFTPWTGMVMTGGVLLYGGIIIDRRTELRTRQERRLAFDHETPQLIDAMINDSFNEYLILNRGFKADNEALIGSKEEAEIVSTIVDSVSSRMSQTVLDKLEAYYDKDSVPDIVSRKIFMAVTSFVVDHNAPRSDIPDLTDPNRKEDMMRYL